MDMTTNTRTTATTATRFDDPRTQRALTQALRCITAYGALSTLLLLVVITAFGRGHAVSVFMWVRASLMPVVAVVLYWLTHSASGGSRRALDRVRGVSVVLPIAIIGVDLIPGICPHWYAAAQAVCMLPVIAVAIITRGAALRTAFPKSR